MEMNHDMNRSLHVPGTTESLRNKAGSKTPHQHHERRRTSRGLIRNDFRKIAPNGFGDPYNNYAHSMVWFKDHLYVGTSRANLAYRGRWRSERDGEGLGETWPVRIPRGLFDIDLRAQIWRYDPITGNWDNVYISPLVTGIDGFEVPLSIGFRTMVEFQGASDASPGLYVPTWGSHQTPEGIMLRTVDGLNFEAVSEPGFGFPDRYKPRALRGMVFFKGRIFTSPATGRKRGEPNTAGFMVILESPDPARGKWQLACQPHFGNPNNLSVFEMVVFQGYLYAGTLNINEGFQVWKTDAEGKPPYKWEKVITHGAYRGNLNSIAIRMVPFRDSLYVGTGIQEGGWDISNKIGPDQPEVIRINPDDSWDLVVGNPRITPEGLKVPLSGLRAGFGNPFSGYIWTLREHAGWLYVGDSDWTLLIRFLKRDNWSNSFLKMYTPQKIERIIREFGGFSLWRTRDGNHWVPVTLNGFGNCFNNGVRNMLSTPYGLFVGTVNPFSPEVAVKRVAGWNYEKNPRGGLEIWLGSYETDPNVRLESLKDNQYPSTASCLIADSGKKREEDAMEAVMEQFYGESDFRHPGFWQEDIHDARTACENLMDEIVAFLPRKEGTIADIDCGSGATTKYLLKFFRPDEITGVTAGRKALKKCRGKTPQVNFIETHLPDLKLPSEFFDCVVRVKGFDSFDTEYRLLQECFRILKPGGQFVCFDILPVMREQKNKRQRISASKDPAHTLDEYRDALSSARFENIRIADVTSECLNSFRKHVGRYFRLKRLSGDREDEILQRAEDYFLTAAVPERQCLLISGFKAGKPVPAFPAGEHADA
jgi:ubiquinone/menaquinone biosynthesis C-methylase UbiE